MIKLTLEQAQQIEKELEYARNVCAGNNWSTEGPDDALSTIRAARAQEQSEQGPVTDAPFSNCKYQVCDLPGQCIGEGKCHHPLKNIEPVKQAEQEPVAVVEITYGREPECYVTGNIDGFPEGVFKLYATPVRAKDLTDDEIYECYTSDAHENTPRSFARAVIAAHKEKNK